MTFVSSIISRFLSWAGESSSSQTMPVAPVCAISSSISVTFPVPTYVPGWIFSLFWIRVPTTAAPAVFTSSLSSFTESSASSPSCSLTPTRMTFSSISSIFIVSAIYLLYLQCVFLLILTFMFMQQLHIHHLCLTRIIVSAGRYTHPSQLCRLDSCPHSPPWCFSLMQNHLSTHRRLSNSS